MLKYTAALISAALITLATLPPSEASTRDRGASRTVSCHCDRYSDPHYSRYVPRTAPYRGGRPTRY